MTKHQGELMLIRRALIGAAGVWVLGRPALAQPTRKVYRIGLIFTGLASEYSGSQPQQPTAREFVRTMSELGYVYGGEGTRLDNPVHRAAARR